MRQKKVKRKVGDFVKVVLQDGAHCYARVLDDPLIAFYDLKTHDDLEIVEIEKRAILFKIWVMNNAITSGRWEVIGHKDLDDTLKESVTFFKEDAISNEVCLYVNSKEIPATREQCKDLERAAVWSAHHVEDRLRDHFEGVPNKWVESLKLKMK